jgi:P-type E1-E2 ATPase
VPELIVSRGRTDIGDPASEPCGLSEAEAARRLSKRCRVDRPSAGRSYASIVRANVLTVFNLVLAGCGALTLVLGDWRDALFLGVVVANAAIGITQEVRAKRALERLAALVTPTATVVRDGHPRSVRSEDVVEDDIVRVEPGDQIVADGVIEVGDRLELDESILTGESEAVGRDRGQHVRSGSFVVEGVGAYRVLAVGDESYAGRLTGSARAFRHPRSPLELALNRLLLVLVGVMAPLALALAASLLLRDVSIREAVETSVAAAVSMVPEGLILLASLTFAVATLRMARRGALAQQLNAIESLASVDIVCLDKTGTLTEGTLRVVDVVPADSAAGGQLKELLARYAAAARSRTSTIEAIAGAPVHGTADAGREVAFSSRRRWSALELDGAAYALGAPELFDLGPLAERCRAETAGGRRVLAFGTCPVLPPADAGRPGASLLGLVVLAERLRPEARTAVEYLRAQGVDLLILSGDAPATAAAIARDAGVAMAGDPLDGRELPKDPTELRERLAGVSVVGRVSPDDKRRVIAALTEAGRYVAMIGDGANDVPALKAARLAIAPASGVQMAKAVADLVLVRGDFGAIPGLVEEGRRILRNVTRVSRLFATKAVFAGFLIVAIGLWPIAYPLLPRHFTLAGALAIGIPGFVLALAPSSGPFRTSGLVRSLFRFALPAGLLVGLAIVASYLVARLAFHATLGGARTVATGALVATGLIVIAALQRPRGATQRAAVAGLCLAMAALFVLTLVVPFLRTFFALEL